MTTINTMTRKDLGRAFSDADCERGRKILADMGYSPDEEISHKAWEFMINELVEESFKGGWIASHPDGTITAIPGSPDLAQQIRQYGLVAVLVEADRRSGGKSVRALTDCRGNRITQF